MLPKKLAHHKIAICQQLPRPDKTCNYLSETAVQRITSEESDLAVYPNFR